VRTRETKFLTVFAFRPSYLLHLYEDLVEKSEGKRPLGKPRNRREDNNLYLKEMRSEGWH
jgi:hypothetical protein